MLKPYRVTYRNGYETTLLLTEDYQRRYHPTAILVEEEVKTVRKRKPSANKAEQPEDTK